MLDYIIEPVQIDLPLDKPQSTRVRHLGCGRAHTIVITDGAGGRFGCPLFYCLLFFWTELLILFFFRGSAKGLFSQYFW